MKNDIVIISITFAAMIGFMWGCHVAVLKKEIKLLKDKNKWLEKVLKFCEEMYQRKPK